MPFASVHEGSAAPSVAPSCAAESPPAWQKLWREPELWLVVALALGLYFWRLTLLPPCGEETRVATMAQEMIDSGDWVVPRQQGFPFPERPPLGSWCVALASLALGEPSVGTLAIRLPSVIAILLTAVVIYIYARQFLMKFGAFVSAVAFLTAGQVIQLGRHGESEPIFTLLVGSSLLVWHLGVLRGWSSVWSWSLGYGLAALGALVKGPQAPIYFAGSVGVFLVLTRDWRRLVSWSHLAGIAIFCGVIALWLLPFQARAGAAAATDIWTLLAKKRFGWGGLIKHLGAYPLETLACLLPWSPLLVHFGSSKLRASLANVRLPLMFLLVCVAVTYPSVLLAAGARGRYYMPLYPCLAVLMGIAIERSVLAPADSFVRRGWNRFLAVLAIVAGASGVAVVFVRWFPTVEIAQYAPGIGLTLLLMAASGAATVCLWRARCGVLLQRATVAVAMLAAWIGVAYTGVVIGIRAQAANDMTSAVSAVKAKLPQPKSLVSLGPIVHQFAYYYRDAIRELPWPTQAEAAPHDFQLDPQLDYFCFHVGELDGNGQRQLGRGIEQETVSSELPFAWEEVARVYYGRNRDDRRSYVVIARVIPQTARRVK